MIVDLTEALASQIGIEFSEHNAKDFRIFAELILEWNEKMNLTAITEPKDMAIKHFLDSLTVLPIFPEDKNCSVIDIGSGAGFPGIPLAIMCRNLDFTLLDSLNKRVTFLDTVIKELGLHNATAVHGRAEQLGREPQYREQYDYAIARAVSNLSALCEYALPLVKVGGYFIAMKGKEIEEEISSAQLAIKELSGELKSIQHITLPDGSERNIVMIKKISQTSSKYPRPFTKISKNPL